MKVIGIDRILGIAVLASLLAVAGCGSDHHHGGFVKVTPRPPSKTSPGSGLFAVDCKRSRGAPRQPERGRRAPKGCEPR